MISQIFSIEKTSLESLAKNHYSQKLKSHYDAYGCEYDFCRFYEISSEYPVGLISIFNSAMIIALNDKIIISDEILNEIKLFICMNSPYVIETDIVLGEKLRTIISDEYDVSDRTLFEFPEKIISQEIKVDESPRLDDVFDVLSEGFPNMKNSYDLWLTDTSHRLRRSMCKVYLYQKASTVTVSYITDGVALLGGVATLPQMRGKNLARKLLYYVISDVQKAGNTAILIAKENRVSYYTEIGFKAVSKDLLFERKQLDE